MQNVAGVLLAAVSVAAALIALFLDELKGKRAIKIGLLGFCGVVAVFGIYFSFSGLEQPSVSSSGEPNLPVAIDSQWGWQSTGIFVNEGDRISVSVVGGNWTASRRLLSDEEKVTLPEEIKYLQMFVHLTYEANGAGTSSACTEHRISGCPMPDELWGKLVARIGLGDPFAVGNQSIFTAASSGMINLRMNDPDSNLSDNSGVLAVIVETERR